MVGLVVLAMALSASLFALLGFSVGYNTSTHRIFGGLAGLVIAVGVFFLIILACKTQNEAIAERYNNGTCTECGGDYEFSGTTRTNSSQYYFYTCDNCGHTIETNKIMK